jgi:hypothetical protein
MPQTEYSPPGAGPPSTAPTHSRSGSLQSLVRLPGAARAKLSNLGKKDWVRYIEDTDGQDNENDIYRRQSVRAVGLGCCVVHWVLQRGCCAAPAAAAGRHYPVLVAVAVAVGSVAGAALSWVLHRSGAACCCAFNSTTTSINPLLPACPPAAPRLPRPCPPAPAPHPLQPADQVFTFERWNKHRNPMRYAKHLLHMFTSRVFRQLLGPVLAVMALALFVAVYETLVGVSLHLPSRGVLA